MSAGAFALIFSTRAPRLAWLLGAGASAAAGIPTGYDMILDFKVRLFAKETKLPRREVDPGDPLWVERITSYFDDAHGLPPAGAPEEYAAAFEAVYPDAADRRQYIEDAIRQGSPSYGHRVLAALIASHQVPCVFETNFDPMVENSVTVADDLLPADQRVHLTTAAIDSAGRADRCLREGSWPLLAKLHGDYKEDQLRNSSAELQSQDAAMRNVLIGCLRRFGLVVAGYSGRDASVMAALREAVVDSAFAGGLFWVTRPRAALLPAVMDLLEFAAVKGVETYIVEAETFDELAGELDRQADLPQPLVEHVRAARPAARVQPVTVPTKSVAQFPVLQCSALPILELPTIARRVVLSKESTTPALQALLREAGLRKHAIACIGREAAAFGRDAELLKGLSPLDPKLDGEMPLDPLNDSWALGLLYDALTRALCRTRPLMPQLRHRGHQLVVRPPDNSRDDEYALQDRRQLKGLKDAYDKALTGTVGTLSLPYAEAVRLRLERRLGRWWCVYDPFTWIDFPRHLPREHSGSEPATNGEETLEDHDPEDEEDPERREMLLVAADWRRERWATRHNSAWAAILQSWSKLLAPENEPIISSFGHEAADGHNATFMLGTWTAWSRPSQFVQ